MCGDVRAAFRGTSSEGLDCETLFRLVSPSLFTGRAGPRGSSLAPAFCSFDWPARTRTKLLDLLLLLSVSGDPQFWLASLPLFFFHCAFFFCLLRRSLWRRLSSLFIAAQITDLNTLMQGPE